RRFFRSFGFRLVFGLGFGVGFVGFVVAFVSFGVGFGSFFRRRFFGRFGFRLAVGRGRFFGGRFLLRLGLLGVARHRVLLLLGAHRTFPEPAWPRKTRVGANSPSLWPTIASLTKTGTCFLPSCTAIV